MGGELPYWKSLRPLVPKVHGKACFHDSEFDALWLCLQLDDTGWACFGSISFIADKRLIKVIGLYIMLTCTSVCR